MTEGNNNNITATPYAAWLEQTLRDISGMPIRGIALVAVTDDSAAWYTNYYECTMVDKILLSGIINQDATLDMMAAQGIINYDDEEEDVDGEEEE